MSWDSGRKSDAKKLLIRLPETPGDDKLYALNSAQTKALLSLSISIAWHTRHITFPDYIDTPDKLQAFADDTARDLMMPVDICAELVNCTDELSQIMQDLIASDTNVQNAIKDMLLADNDFITNINNIYPPLPPTTLNPGTEDLDILWAQCVGIVEYTHNAINDLFDILEVQSNNIELVQNINLIPGMAAIMAVIPVTQFFSFVDYLLATLNEQYEAQWEETPPTGTKWIIACKIFCACKADRVITVDRIFGAIVDLVSQYTSFDWDNLEEIVESLIGVNDNSEIMVYVTFGLMWGTAKLASSFGLHSLTNKALEVIIALHDEGSNDWEVYCEDCADSDWVENDFTGGDMHDWEAYAPSIVFAEFVNGWKRKDDTTQIAIIKTIPYVITDIEVYFNAPLDGSGGVFWAGSTGLTGLQVGSTTDQQKFTWTGLAISGGLGFDLYRPGGFLSDQYVTKVRYKIGD
jgi:hypothetical protein